MSSSYRGSVIDQSLAASTVVFLELVRGFNEPLPVRGSDIVIPSKAGRFVTPRQPDMLRVELEGVVLGAPGATELASFLATSQSVRALFDPTIAGTLVVDLDGSSSATLFDARTTSVLWERITDSAYRVNVELESPNDWVVGAFGTIGPELIDSGPATYGPTIAYGGGALGLIVGVLDAAGAIFAPTVADAATIVAPGLITNSPAIYAPQVAKAIAAVYADVILADGAIGYWRLGESSLPTAVDGAGTNDGTYTGSPTLGVTGALAADGDTAVAFNGVSQYVTIADDAALDLGDTFTIEAWARRTGGYGVNYRYIASKGAQFGLSFQSDDTVLFDNDGSACSTSSSSISDTAWHHIVATRGAGTDKIYIDGADVTVPGTLAGRSSTTDPLNIGRYIAGSDYLLGEIDEVAYYPTALSASQALTHYEIGTGAAGEGLTVGLINAGATIYAATVALDTGGGFPPDTTLSYVARPTIPSLPTLGVPVDDTTWGTKVVRVSDVASRRHSYSRIAAWSCDGSKLLLAGHTSPWQTLDGADYSPIRTSSTLLGYPTWSMVDGNLIYGTYDSDNHLYTQNMTTDVQTSIHTFTGYDHVSLGQGEGAISDSDGYVALQTRVGSTHGMLVYDITGDSIVDELSFGTTAPDNITISRTGLYVVVEWDTAGSGSQQGTWRYDATDLTSKIQLTTGRSHFDTGYDGAGNEIMVMVSPGVVSYRLDTGASTQLLASGSAVDYSHVSLRAHNRNGWAYLSIYDYTDTSGLAGQDQVLAVKTDGSGTVEVFAFSNHSGDGNPYTSQPQACPSPNGERVVFASEWDGSAVYAYVAGLTV